MSDRNPCRCNRECSDSPCCKDPFRTCFGKRSDAFFCYNDDKAKLCPSMWHPRNPSFVSVKHSCSCHTAVRTDEQPLRIENERKPVLQTYTPTSEYPSGNVYRKKPAKQPKMGRELLDIRDYLRNCMYQRLNVDWTDEDDAILIKCIYTNLVKLRGPGKVCLMLDQVLQRSKNALLNEFVLKLRNEFYKNGSCENPPPTPYLGKVAQGKSQAQYQYHNGPPSDNDAHYYPQSSTSNRDIEMECYVCGKLPCNCDRKRHERSANETAAGYVQSASHVHSPKPEPETRYLKSSYARNSRNGRIDDDDDFDESDDEPPKKTQCRRMRCHCRSSVGSK